MAKLLRPSLMGMLLVVLVGSCTNKSDSGSSVASKATSVSGSYRLLPVSFNGRTPSNEETEQLTSELEIGDASAFEASGAIGKMEGIYHSSGQTIVLILNLHNGSKPRSFQELTVIKDANGKLKLTVPLALAATVEYEVVRIGPPSRLSGK